MVHNLMLNFFQDGGFDGARDCDRKLLISLSALQKYWTNWVVPMTKKYKCMCVYEKCEAEADM